MIQETIPELEELKFCNKCKHLLGVRYDPPEKWNCGHKRNYKLGLPNLLNGTSDRIFMWKLVDLRYPLPGTRTDSPFVDKKIVWLNSETEFPCGQTGRWFEEYIPPDHTIPVTPTIKGIEATEIIFDPSEIEEGKKKVRERLAALRNKSRSSDANLSTIKADEL